MVIQTTELIPFIPNNLLFSCHKFVDVYIINTYWELTVSILRSRSHAYFTGNFGEDEREWKQRSRNHAYILCYTYGFSVLDLNMLLPSLGVERKGESRNPRRGWSIKLTKRVEPEARKNPQVKYNIYIYILKYKSSLGPGRGCPHVLRKPKPIFDSMGIFKPNPAQPKFWTPQIQLIIGLVRVGQV